MSRTRLLAALAAAVALPCLVAVGPAAAQEVGSQPARLEIEVTATPTSLTIELDGSGAPTAPAQVTYEVWVSNPGDGIVPGVEVVDRLPAGVTVGGQREVRFSVGDLAAANTVRQVLVADVDPSALGGESRLVNTAEARSADGQVASSEAVTDVTVISAATVEREPATPVPAATTPASPATTVAPLPPTTVAPSVPAAAEPVAAEPAAFSTGASDPGDGPGGRAWPVAVMATLVMAMGACLTVAARSRARRLHASSL